MIFKALSEIQFNNQSCALCTIVRAQGSTPRHVGSKMVVYPDGRIIGTIGGGELESRVINEALAVIKSGNPIMLEYQMTDPKLGDPGVCGGSLEVFVDPIKPKPKLIIVGAGHVGRAVAHLAKWLGFFVVVTDDRPEFCTPELVPGADEFFPIPFSEFADNIDVTPWTYFVLTTRNVDVDIQGLPAIIKSPAAYIGIIGSKRRWQTTKQKLLEKGFTQNDLEVIKSPIGLDLNAETPEEIAVSILAEIILLRRGENIKS
jgi:xanthine dehydrogenase accessory factor